MEVGAKVLVCYDFLTTIILGRVSTKAFFPEASIFFKLFSMGALRFLKRHECDKGLSNFGDSAAHCHFLVSRPITVEDGRDKFHTD